MERILVVDDDPALRSMVSMNFVSDGHEVFEAGDGYEALEIVRHEHPTIVILDVMMSGMEGHEVCSRIRAIQGMENAAIIMLTGLDVEGDEARALQAGADLYMTKPFDQVELYNKALALSAGKRK